MKQLLLVNLDGRVYGIWEDEVLAREGLGTIHHLPAIPAHIAGVSLRRDHTITLADLSVCVGHAAMQRKATGSTLIMSDAEKIAGFAVEAEVGRAAIGPDAVHPLPDYLKTQIIDSCVLMDSLLVLVINISALYHTVLKPDYQPFKPQCIVSGPQQDESHIETIRLFETGGSCFAACAEKMEGPVQKPEQITGLVQAPGFVLGIAFHQGRVLTIIDLQQRISGKDTGEKDQMFVAELGQALFGFVVHADKGTLKKEDFFIRRLPPIAQSSWFRSSIKHAGEIVPLLDLGVLISFGQKGAIEKPLPERYHPDSGFLSVFGKQDTEVVEFPLLNQRHAVPKSEVKDSIGFMPYREIPNTAEIVIGVAEDTDELLPVLDLAMVFGRRSLATPEWRMIKLCNGDFRAFVITEAVFDERQLPLSIQREVPIKLPYAVVYGCYPDADSVRLILNVQALTVYFEKALVQELLPAMTPEMKQARAEIVPALLGEPLASTYQGISEKLQKPESTPVTTASPQTAGPEELWSSQKQPLSHEEENAAFVQAKKPEMVSGPVQVEEEISKVVIEEAELPAAEEVHEEVVQQRVEEAGEGKRSENILPEEALPVTEPVVEAEPFGEQKEQELETPGEEKISEQPFQEKLAPAPEGLIVAEAPVQAVPETAEQPALEIEQGQAPEEAVPVSEAPVEAAQVHGSVTIRMAYHPDPQLLDHETTEEPIAPQIKQEEPVSFSRKSRLMAIGAVIVVIILVAVLFQQVVTSQKKKMVQREKPATVISKVPLVLTAPADVRFEIDKYIVKKGDTLWDISKRFTGNPFNYPGIAGENKIPNPDLIYPEQKIIIKKKEP